jgi:hypothetical protein
VPEGHFMAQDAHAADGLAVAVAEHLPNPLRSLLFSTAAGTDTTCERQSPI